MDKQGRPTNTFYFRCLKREATDMDLTVGDLGKVTAKYLPRCSFCWQGPPFKTAHTHTQCPFVGTVNKIRAHQSLVPLEVVEGKLVRSDHSVPLEVEKEIKSMKTQLVEIKALVDKIVAHHAATSMPSKAGPSNKRGATEAAVGAPQPKGKKAKKGPAEAAKPAVAPDQGKGKGKKGKRGPPAA